MHSSKTRPEPNRLLQLDLLRGLAILLVLGRHPVFFPDSGPMLELSRFWFRFGWTGVDLFFVLSGFLIGGLLFNELVEHNELDVRRFLYRRGFKIWPSYYCYIAVVFVLLCFRVPMTVSAGYPIKQGVWPVVKNLASNVLNIQNYVRTIRFHTWSLAVEEHFYLILPFVLYWLIRRRRAAGGRIEAIPDLPKIAVGLIVFCTAGRYLASQQPTANFASMMLPTHLRIDGLFFGVLLAYWARFSPHWIERMGRHRHALLIVGLVLVSPMMVFEADTIPVLYSFGTAMLYLGYGAILTALVATPIGHGWLGRFLGSRPARMVAYIGFYSYPIYLWHVDLAQAPLLSLERPEVWTQMHPVARWCCETSIYVALSTAIGVLMSLAIERPTLALRDRLFPRRSTALEPAELPAAVADQIEPAANHRPSEAVDGLAAEPQP